MQFSPVKLIKLKEYEQWLTTKFLSLRLLRITKQWFIKCLRAEREVSFTSRAHREKFVRIKRDSIFFGKDQAYSILVACVHVFDHDKKEYYKLITQYSFVFRQSLISLGIITFNLKAGGGF